MNSSKLLSFLFLLLVVTETTFAKKGSSYMSAKYIYQLSFPFEQFEQKDKAPVVTATIDKQVVFKDRPSSHLLTNVPITVRDLKANSDQILILVTADTGAKKEFSVDLKKGVYLLIYFDLKENEFNLVQEADPRGYD